MVPALAAQPYRRSRSIASRILNLGTRWRWVVNFTQRALGPWKRNAVTIKEETVWGQSGLAWLWISTQDSPVRSQSLCQLHDCRFQQSIMLNACRQRYGLVYCAVGQSSWNTIQVIWMHVPCIFIIVFITNNKCTTNITTLYITTVSLYTL